MIRFERTAVAVPAFVHFETFTRSLDADVNRAGEVVFVTRDVHGISVHFPHRGTAQVVPRALLYPHIRWIGPSRALLFDSIRRDHQDNAWIIDHAGRTMRSFSIGDAVEDVLGNGSHIIATYFDEGVFGDDPLSNNGIAVFGPTGEFLWGWNSSALGRQLAVYDCYAAGLSNGDAMLGAFLYSNYENGPSYAFAQLDLETRVAVLHAVPDDDLHRPHALSAAGDGVWLFVAGPRDGQRIIAWRPGDETYVAAPTPVHLTRGLGGGRFLSITDDSVEVVTAAVERGA